MCQAAQIHGRYATVQCSEKLLFEAVLSLEGADKVPLSYLHVPPGDNARNIIVVAKFIAKNKLWG